MSSSTEGILTVERMDTRTLKDQVAHLVSVAILSGKIKAGERLNESKLARDLGVSRIPIREALQELQERGLVVNMPRRGKFVISLSDEEIQKINSLRLILEAEALRLCRAKINPEGVQSLRSVVERSRDRVGRCRSQLRSGARCWPGSRDRRASPSRR